MNEQELKELALQLHKAQIQEYPWVSADPEDAESYIRTYGDTNVHLYYDYLLANNIGEVEECPLTLPSQHLIESYAMLLDVPMFNNQM